MPQTRNQAKTLWRTWSSKNLNVKSYIRDYERKAELDRYEDAGIDDDE